MSVLVVGECDRHALRISTLSTVTAARELPGDLHLLIIGDNCASVVVSARSVAGVAKVIHVTGLDFSKLTAECLAAQILALVERNHYSHVLATATNFGKNAMPRVAAKLDVAQISEIIAIESPDTFVRPIYAGNAFATIKSGDSVKIVTVRATAFSPNASTGGDAGIETIAATEGNFRSRVIAQELTKLERPELSGARVVISGGRGLGSSENFKMLEPLADKLNAALGASRAAVDAGYVPNDYQVGQTGKIVAPELYIAVGISGAIQHLAGMKDSKVIVAINKDPDAPIFQIADYGLVGDLFEIVPELTAAL